MGEIAEGMLDGTFCAACPFEDRILIFTEDGVIFDLKIGASSSGELTIRLLEKGL